MSDLINENEIRSENFKMSENVTYPNFTRLEKKEDRVNVMNSLLANEYALFTKTLNYHWNVTGPRFHSIHEFLEGHYRELLEVIDDVAERIRKIGGNAIGTLSEMKVRSSIVERPNEYPETSHMISDLMSDHESIEIQIKAFIQGISDVEVDPGTEDFLTGLLKKHEEMSWMLKSNLE